MLKAILDRARDARATEIEGEEAAEAGFTLIELMVVLLIIAILLAIAIPTFLGVTNSANDRAAQSNLTNGLTEVATQYQNNGQSFNGVTTAVMQSSAPEFTWTSGACAAQNCISVQTVDVAAANDGQGIILAADSPNTHTCWFAASFQTNPPTSQTAGTAWVSGETAPAVSFVAQNTSVTPPAATTITGGTWYAAAKPSAKLANCSAAAALSFNTNKGMMWYQSYATASSNMQ